MMAAAVQKRLRHGWDCCDTVLIVLASLCLIAAIVCTFTVLPRCLRKSPSEGYHLRHPEPYYGGWLPEPQYHNPPYQYYMEGEEQPPHLPREYDDIIPADGDYRVDADGDGIPDEGPIPVDIGYTDDLGRDLERPDIDPPMYPDGSSMYYPGPDPLPYYYWDDDVIEATCHVDSIHYRPEPATCQRNPYGGWCGTGRFDDYDYDGDAIPARKRRTSEPEPEPFFRCGNVDVTYTDVDGSGTGSGSLHADVDQEDNFPDCAYDSCMPDPAYNEEMLEEFYHPLEECMEQQTYVTCYYYKGRPEVLYLEEPKPFIWHTSAGFHSIFWPALVGMILVVAVIIRKLVYIAKHRDNGKKANAVAPPPAYDPNLYIINGNAVLGADGLEKKLPVFDGPIVEAFVPPEVVVTDNALDRAVAPVEDK